jgi:amino acid adenylation domain-containing protein
VLDVQGDGSGVREVQRQLPQALSQVLRRQARRLGVSAASVMHQAWSVVLSRLTGRQEVVFGTVLFGRMQGGEQADRVMGMFINTLPIKLEVAEQEVSQGLKDTHRLIAKLLRHEHAPLALAQRCSGVDTQMPLFTTLLNYRHSAQVPQDEADDGIESLSGHERTNYPLTLSVDDLGEGFRLVLQAREPIDAQRVCGYMESALEGLLAALDTGSGTTVGEVDILSAGEREQIVTGWNATARPYPQGRCLHELIEEQVARNPEAVALTFGAQALGYRELNEQANRLARHLVELGVGPDRRVAVCADRGFEMVVALLAVLKAGGAYVPLDPGYPAERLVHMLGDSAPAVVLVDGTGQQALAGQAGPQVLVHLKQDQTLWAKRSAHNLSVAELGESHLAYVIYTSGSTGKPKGAMNEHRGIVNRLLWMQEAYALGWQDVVLQKTPFSFDVSVWEFFWPLMVGARLVLAKPEGHKDPAYLSALMHEQAVSTVHFVPSMLQVFLEQQGLSAGSLRQVICSGEALPGALVGRFHAKLPQVRLHNLYGPTEAAVDVTAWACEAGQERALVPIGRPIANTHMYVLDERRRPVPIGVVGELYIGGVQVGRGYLNQPELTSERFVDDPFSAEQGARMYRTGDLGRWTAEGTIEYLGRNDFQVKIRGFRIELGEVESRLAEHPAIAQAVVVAHDDAQGASLLAYLAPIYPLPCEEPQRGEAQRALIEQARSFLTERLPAHMVPGRFMVIDVIPLSPNGKLDRRALPTPQGLTQGLRSYEAPQSEAETRLAALWSELLGVGEVGRQDNFFELGGHSLLAVKLIERMRREGLHADVRDLFTAPTLGELAQALGGASREVQVPPNLIPEDAKEITPGMLPLVEMEQQAIDAVVSQVEGGAANVQDIYPLAPAQEGILFHHLMQPEGDPYQLPNVLGFADKARLDSFVRALQELVDRHDILRTGVHWQGLEQPVQVVRRQVKLPVEVARFDPRLGEVQPQLEAMLDPARHRLDVSRAPLVKCVVAQDEAHRRWLLGIVVHHLAIDHTTLEMLVHEAQAIEQGLRERLSRPVPFRNFVAQARLGVSEAEHEAFFSQMLSGVDEPTAPYGVLDVQGDGSGVREVQRQLPQALSQVLRRQARRLGVSAASVMHQAWSVVLSRLTGRQEVVFGTVLFGRMQGGEQADRVMGMFINTLPIKLEVAGQEVSQGLKDTHALLAKLLRHEHAPLALAQRCSGVDAQMPLFTTLLNYRHTRTATVDTGLDQGLQAPSSHVRTSYPVTVSVDDVDDGRFELTVLARYPIDAERIAGYMVSAVNGLVDALRDGSTPSSLHDIDILSPQEQQAVLQDYNQTRHDYPRDLDIATLFEQQAARTPQATAVEHHGAALGYAQLNLRANRLAHALRSQGLAEGQAVALFLPRSADLVVALLAVLKAAGVYVPLDEAMPDQRLSEIVLDSGAKWIVTHRTARLPAGLAGLVRVDVDDPALQQQPGHELARDTGGGSAAYVMYTSGSTGKPKGVVVPHRGIARLVLNNGYADFRASDRMAFAANPAFDALTLEVWAPLLNGGTIVVIDQPVLLDPDRFAAELRSRSVDVMWLTVGLFNQYEAALAPVIPQLRYLMIGGDALDPRVVARVLAQCPPQHLLNGYGPTETTTFALTHEIRSLEPDARSVPLGRPIGNTQVYVLDERRQPVPIGVAGEIYIGGDGVALGYLHREDLTAERFVHDPFSAQPGARMYRTGDLGRWTSEGVIEFLGRNDFQVKIRGFRIELGEIEARLASHPAIREVSVLAREEILGDKRLVAYYTAEVATAAEDLRAHLIATLPEYMVPAAYVHLEALPLTPNGKLDRQALPAPEGNACASRAYEAPQGEVEETIANIWAKLLKLEQVGRHDNFFELGGHSILAMKVMAAIEKQFGVRVTVRILFEKSTAASLGAHIDLLRAMTRPEHADGAQDEEEFLEGEL